jgi:hypothetical protein
MSQRNKQRVKKIFKEGDVVIQRQTQVAVGPHNSIQPKFTGPYVITEITDNNSSALLKNIKTKRLSKSHFSWLQYYRFDPKSNRLPQNFEDQIEDITPPELSQRIRSPPPPQPQMDNDDGADNEDLTDFMDDQEMFHSFKTRQTMDKRQQSQLTQATQTQQTQTTPQDEPAVNDSSTQTQQPSQFELQTMDDDDIADIHFDNNQFDFDDQQFDFTPQEQFQPFTQKTRESTQHTTDSQFEHNIPSQQDISKVQETQLTNQTQSTSQSQIGPSQPPNIKTRKIKLSVQHPKELQQVVDIIDRRNEHTTATFINDEILETQFSQTDRQQLLSQPAPLEDEFHTQTQPQPNAIIRIQYIPDDPQNQITERLHRQQRPRPRPRQRPRPRSPPPRQRHRHRYPTRSKYK